MPLKGGIQFEEGIDQERMARAEKNMAYQTVAACRQHSAIDQVGYGTATYRMGEGRKPGTQWFQEVMVTESVCEEILGKGEPTQEGSPGWTSVERGTIQGSEEKWILITGTAKYDRYENGEVKEEDWNFRPSCARQRHGRNTRGSADISGRRRTLYMWGSQHMCGVSIQEYRCT